MSKMASAAASLMRGAGRVAGPAALGLMGAQAVGEVVGGPLMGALDSVLQGPSRVRSQVDVIRDENDRRMAEHERLARIKRDTQVNAIRLAQASPQLYTQMLAANHFPQGMPDGSSMVGGEPAYDLVNEVAYMMSQGKFGQPQ